MAAANTQMASAAGADKLPDQPPMLPFHQLPSLKAGLLTKQGSLFKSWKHRFFLLSRSGFLFYYLTNNHSSSHHHSTGIFATPDEGPPRGALIIPGSVITEEPELSRSLTPKFPHHSSVHAFSVTAPKSWNIGSSKTFHGRKYVFVSESFGEMSEWIAILQLVARRKQISADGNQDDADWEEEWEQSYCHTFQMPSSQQLHPNTQQPQRRSATPRHSSHRSTKGEMDGDRNAETTSQPHCQRQRSNSNSYSTHSSSNPSSGLPPPSSSFTSRTILSQQTQSSGHEDDHTQLMTLRSSSIDATADHHLLPPSHISSRHSFSNPVTPTRPSAPTANTALLHPHHQRDPSHSSNLDSHFPSSHRHSTSPPNQTSSSDSPSSSTSSNNSNHQNTHGHNPKEPNAATTAKLRPSLTNSTNSTIQEDS